MKIRWKIPVIILAAVVAAFLLLRVALGWLIPGEGIRQSALEQVTEATGAEVSLGEASVRIWPSIAITMGQGRIQGTGKALAEKTGSDNTIESYAVDLDLLALDLKIGPLLRGRIELGTVNLSCPQLQVVDQEGTIRIEGLELEISDFFLPATAAVADSPAVETGPQAPGETIPEDLSLTFAASAIRLFWQEVPYEEVEVQGELDTRLLLVESFSALRSTGRVDGALEVDYERDPWGILDFEAVITDVPSAALLEPWAPDLASRLDCDLSGEISGGCGLKDSDTVAGSLDLAGRLGSGPGILRAGDWLDDIASYLGERQDLKDIRFTELNHSFRVSEGQYLIEELTVGGGDTDWDGDGWVGLDGTIDLDLGVKLPAGFTPELGQLSFLAEGLRDEDQRVNLVLHLTGQSARPRVSLKLGGFLDKLKTK